MTTTTDENGQAVQPEHGATRDWRMHVETDDRVELVLEGGAVCRLPRSCQQWSVLQQYCATCERWYLVEGVTGALRWIATHEGPHDALPLEVDASGY